MVMPRLVVPLACLALGCVGGAGSTADEGWVEGQTVFDPHEVIDHASFVGFVDLVSAAACPGSVSPSTGNACAPLEVITFEVRETLGGVATFGRLVANQGTFEDMQAFSGAPVRSLLVADLADLENRTVCGFTGQAPTYWLAADYPNPPLRVRGGLFVHDPGTSRLAYFGSVLGARRWEASHGSRINPRFSPTEAQLRREVEASNQRTTRSDQYGLASEYPACDGCTPGSPAADFLCD